MNLPIYLGKGLRAKSLDVWAWVNSISWQAMVFQLAVALWFTADEHPDWRGSGQRELNMTAGGSSCSNGQGLEANPADCKAETKRLAARTVFASEPVHVPINI